MELAPVAVAVIAATQGAPGEDRATVETPPVIYTMENKPIVTCE